MIEGLHDITLPAPVSYLPQTIGWLVAAILILALAVWIGYRVARHRRANQYRGIALARLAELEQDLTSPFRTRALAAIPQLVKRVTLEAYPRTDVASLSGEAWLEFLDESYGGTDFAGGAGKLLPVLSYVSPTRLEGIPDNELFELTALIQRWIKKHHP